MLGNRVGGPEMVIDEVERRAPDGFDRLDDVIDPAELEAIGKSYAAASVAAPPASPHTTSVVHTPTATGVPAPHLVCERLDDVGAGVSLGGAVAGTSTSALAHQRERRHIDCNWCVGARGGV
ncbi:hypothetical protein [Pseudonocardia zijingensis]|uniref:Uncharacterized protein n=1 Tax=Pseudonocardia zijingensis TaxID=153376 RepID=A0ABP4ANZ8_9PSEU